MKLREIADRLIIEASLTRMLRLIGDGQFAILNAFRGQYTKKQNMARNREMLHQLNAEGFGAHRLIGHWEECSDDSIPYEKCPEELKRDVTEESFFVPCPPDKTRDFEQRIRRLCMAFDQDGYILGDQNHAATVSTKTGEVVDDGPLHLHRIGRSYSQHVRKLNVPFKFEGLEAPANNLQRHLWHRQGWQVPLSE